TMSGPDFAGSGRGQKAPAPLRQVATMSGARLSQRGPVSFSMTKLPCSASQLNNFVDSKGHSRFVLRILIIPSHRGRKQGESLPLRASVATVGAFPTVGFLPMFHGPTVTSNRRPRSGSRDPVAAMSGPDLARQGSLI